MIIALLRSGKRLSLLRRFFLLREPERHSPISAGERFPGRVINNNQTGFHYFLNLLPL